MTGTVQAVRRSGFTAQDRERVLDLWSAVTEAGGAVGFVPGAARADIETALRAHEDSMRAGYTVAVLVRIDAEIVAMAFLEQVRNVLLAHGRWVYRVMVDPARQRSGLGRHLMHGVHDVARSDGVEIISLGVRGGYGTEAFYASVGYLEVGRIVGAIRVAPGDDRDDITMSRRLDRHADPGAR
ncbi:MAG: GNAT family N-acetyltransferase [Phycicoccus sp.]|nr:GNAT family N-acetyltransferase [Phycicoccus sp.]